MRYVYHPDALTEYADAALYYDERVPALGWDFTKEVDAAIELITQAPNRWRSIDEYATLPTAPISSWDSIYGRGRLHFHRGRHALKPGARILEASLNLRASVEIMRGGGGELRFK